MKSCLSQYATDLIDASLLVQQTATDDPCIMGLTYDSKAVQPGTLFVCKGAAFKKEYLLEAIQKGASAYVSEVDYGISSPALIVHDIRIAMPILANRFFESPQKDLCLIGVTGTKGKSSTCYFLRSILNAWMRAQNLPDVGIISSIRTSDGVIDEESHLTTPESIELYRHLHHARSSNLKYVIIEASSQALKYNRLDGILFDVAAFLNISEDHISPIEHADFGDYFAAKCRIVEHTKQLLINLDMDPSALAVLKASLMDCSVQTVSCHDDSADFYANQICLKNNAYEFEVHEAVDGSKTICQTGIRGLFNVENALFAYAMARVLGCPMIYIQDGLVKARPAGRMMHYETHDHQISVLVDYAHNALSFEKLFDSADQECPNHRKVILYGSAGNKAYTRRRDLGLVSGQRADFSYLTEDDANFESVQAICEEIGQYIAEVGGSYAIIEDRTKAIQTAFHEAVQMAQMGQKTLLLITGKGDETTMKRLGHYEPIETDPEIVKRLIKDYDAAMQIDSK